MSISRFVFVAVLVFTSVSATAATRRACLYEEGKASWYGGKFHGRQTASGEVYDKNGLSAAHQFLPFGTELLVTNLDNGRSLVLKVNDRGPFVGNRILDCSEAAAEALGYRLAGLANVRLEILDSPPPVTKARLKGRKLKRLEKALKKAQRRCRSVELPDGPGPIAPSSQPVPAPVPATAPPQVEEAPPPPVFVTRPHYHAVQVGAFRERARAEGFMGELRLCGYTVRRVTTAGWHRVQVGPYSSRADAEAAAASLAEAGHPTLIVEIEKHGATQR
ncbi:MAG: septal ring lytic transglycosylase RlpA family protein [Acidobacteriota bacterium]